MRRTRADVAVIGGGVAGCALASSIGAQGVETLLVERESEYRDRVRGEGIYPWGVAELDQLGLLDYLRSRGLQELPFWKQYYHRELVEESHWLKDESQFVLMSMHHPRLQQALFDRVVSLGVRSLRPASILGIDPGVPTTITISYRGEVLLIETGLVIFADGRRSLASGGARGEIVSEESDLAVSGYLIPTSSFDGSATHFGVLPHSRALVFPLGDGRARAYLIAARSPMRRVMASGRAGIMRCIADHFPADLGLSPPVGPMASFAAAASWPRSPSPSRYARIGDAAGSTDPAFAMGLSLCFRDARLLSSRLLTSSNGQRALDEFSAARRGYFETLRAHARWSRELWFGSGPGANEGRRRALVARSQDPGLGGWERIETKGPDGLEPSQDARNLFFGKSQ